MQKTTIYTASRWVKTCLRRSLQLKLSTYWAIPLSDSQTTDASVHDSNIIKPLIDEAHHTVAETYAQVIRTSVPFIAPQ